MALTRPIPRECRQIVREIRARVDRPSTEEEYAKAWGRMCGVSFTWRFLAIDEDGEERWCCPMGLLDDDCDIPERQALYVQEEPVETEKAATAAFANWWDEQRDLEAATRAVWGW